MNKLILILALTMSFNVFSSPKSICGIDDRVISHDPKIGRALDSAGGTAGCTLTMISKSCAISAGHCKVELKIAEFNTPLSINGKIQHPPFEDVYLIDQKSISHSTGPGADYAVFKIKPHLRTGLYAGDAQGYYPVSFKKPRKGDLVRITGYGLDLEDPIRNLAQQTSVGEIHSFAWLTPTMHHLVDTMGGNSGSAVILERSGEIVAIHTQGGCSQKPEKNSSTLISKNETLSALIKSCISSDN